jgi:tRNA (guanosine-2'-O-)-methyltransferase
MMTTRRINRFHQVLDNRIGYIHCAIESLYHRHNVSAVLRTCDSVGLQHIHLVEGHFHASRGAAKGAERWLTLHKHESARQAVEVIKSQGLALWIADFSDSAISPEQLPLDRPVCVWLGAELAGVSKEARAAADGVLKIPMRGFAQSLNVSVAAAITLYTLSQRVRQTLGEAALLSPAEKQALWETWLAREEAKRNGIKSRC